MGNPEENSEGKFMALELAIIRSTDNKMNLNLLELLLYRKENNQQDGKAICNTETNVCKAHFKSK